LPKGPVAIQAAKQALNASIETDLQTGLKIERMLYSKIIDTEDRIEGLKAFNEKRKAVYKGF
jgi:methylglutaconyl-CoA hydratase